jgi:crotonobetainyl-CoA:carnitine CoA-transferase CaiB-like acyl-CoA transferase
VTDLDEWNALTDLIDLGALRREQAPDQYDREVLRAAVTGWCTQFTHHAATVQLQRVGVPSGPVQSVEDVVRDPQLRHRHYPEPHGHPDLPDVEYPGSPYRFSRSPRPDAPPAPRLGSSTRSVLQGWLKISDDELSSLQRAGAIACYED